MFLYAAIPKMYVLAPDFWPNPNRYCAVNVELNVCSMTASMLLVLVTVMAVLIYCVPVDSMYSTSV